MAAGTAAGIAFQIAATNDRNRVSDLSGPIDAPNCSGNLVASERCSELARARADQQFNQNMAYFGFGVAATAALATAVYWLWPEGGVRRKPATRGTALLSVGVEPSRVWLGSSGTF